MLDALPKKLYMGKCTLVWYVDDNELLHEYPKVVTEILKALKKHFEDPGINMGNTHTFLGMNINTRDDNKIEIYIKDKIQEAIYKFDDKFNGVVSSPAEKHLC